MITFEPKRILNFCFKILKEETLLFNIITKMNHCWWITRKDLRVTYSTIPKVFLKDSFWILIFLKVFTEIKRLYGRLEEKPVSARRVLMALIQFFIHHHEDMMVQIDDALELLFKEIPTKCYTSQVAAFEMYELCLRNSDFF